MRRALRRILDIGADPADDSDMATWTLDPAATVDSQRMKVAHSVSE